MYCIRGGARRSWMALPLMEVAGRPCATIKAGSSWLYHLLAGRPRAADYDGAVVNFVRECRAAFVEDVAAQVAASTASSQGDEGMASSHGAQEAAFAQGHAKGKRLILDSDDEADAPCAVVRPLKRKTKQRRLRAGTLVTRSIRNMSLTYTMPHGRCVAVPVDVDALQQIVTDLAGRRGESKQAASRQVPVAGVKGLLEHCDKGRIYWRVPAAAAGYFCVRYCKSNGKMAFFSAGLRVPTTTLTGESLGHEGYMNGAAQVLRRARATWDRMDASAGERYATLG